MNIKGLSAKKILFSIAGVAVIICVIYLAYLSHKAFENTMVFQTQQQLLTIAKSTAISIEEFITYHSDHLKAISTNPLIKDQTGRYRLLQVNYESHKDDVDAIYLLDSRGIVVYRYPEKEANEITVGVDYSIRPGVAYVLKEHKPFVSDVFINKSGEPAISILAPIFHEDQFTGIIRWMISIHRLSKRFIQPIKPGEKGYARLLDKRGVMLAHPKSEHVGKHIMGLRKEAFPDHNWSELENIVKKMMNGEEGIGSYHSAWWMEKNPSWVKKLTAYAPITIGSSMWSIAVSMGYSEIAGPIQKNSRNTLAFAALVIFLLGGAGIVLFRIQKDKAELVTEAKYLKKMATSAEALRKSEEKYRTLFKDSRDAIYINNRDGKIIDVNQSMLDLFGYTQEEMVGKNIIEIYANPEDRPVALDALDRQGSVRDYEIKFKKKDGTEMDCLLTATVRLGNGRSILGYQGIIRDISEKKRLEAQLLQTHRTEAIATLAGGIAHEFNNALVGVTGNLELLQMDLSNEKNLRSYTGRIKESAHRMINLTNQLLAYAQGGKYRPKQISLSDFVEDTLPFIKQTIDPSIRIETDLPLDIVNVEADLTQMQMVLSAILTNASEAIENKGRIRITIRNEEVDEAFAKSTPTLNPGPYVCFMVEDNGMGMDEEAKNKIFDPFFTTKFQGRGLGMAAVYGIVTNHGGWISIDSELGRGTIVRVYLPAIETVTKSMEEPKIIPSQGKKTIMVIDDEEMVMEVTRAMLENIGYSVLEAKTGQEALDIAKAFDGDIDLAILDIVLPDFDGKKIHLRLMETRPDLKVLVCSGYSIDGPAKEILDAGAQDFIQKPFTLAALSEKLNGLLNEG
jgi:PAS domain S-box-containing protein